MSEADRDKWNAIYQGRRERLGPAPLLDRVAGYLPEMGRALDIAGGAGRNAIWLAQRGLDVTVADIASAGLAAARESAAEHGVDIETIEIDLDDAPLEGRFDVVLDFHFLHRPLLAAIDELLSPGGVFVFCQPTARNLERHARPSRRFLLDEGELLGLIADGLEVLHHREGWSEEGRHEAELVARLPHVA